MQGAGTTQGTCWGAVKQLKNGIHAVVALVAARLTWSVWALGVQSVRLQAGA